MEELCDSNPEMTLQVICIHEDKYVYLLFQISVYDHDSSDHPEQIGSTLLTLAQMQSMAESASPAKLVRGARDAGELWVRECTVEQSEKYGAVGEYPARSVDADSVAQDDNQHQECLQHQAAVQELLSQGCENCPSYPLDS